MSQPTAICWFTSYELWTKQHIIIAAGLGRKQIWPFHKLESNKRNTICTEQNTSWWTDISSASKISKPIGKTKVLSLPAQEASISPSHRHFVYQCCVTLSVNIRITHLICRVTINKTCIALVIITTITILITTPTSTNWWSCPTHSAVLPSTNTHHLPATNTCRPFSSTPSMDLPSCMT